MMDVLKAYANQVVSYLPEGQRDELYAEIYDELCEEFADQCEQKPGLSETEFLTAGKQHPMRFATQLASDSKAYLIGPQFYFSFLSALKISFSIAMTFLVLVGAASAFASGNIWGSFWGFVASIPQNLLWVGAAVLGVFIALEKSGEKATWLENWDASELKSADGHQTISRVESSFDLGFSTFALLVILNIIEIPAMVRHDGQWIRDWSVNLPDAFWYIAGAILVFDIGFSLYRMSRSIWTRRLRLVTVVSNILWIALLGIAISQPELLSVEQESVSEFLPIFNKVAKGSLLIACLIIAWDTLSHSWRLLKNM